MSAYQAKISLIVEGEQKIKSLQDRVNNLSKQITELKKLDIGGVFEDPITSGAVSKLRKVRQDEAKATDGIIKGQRLLNNSTEQRLVQQIKLNAAVDLYAARVKALSRTGAGDQKQFQTRVEDIQKAFEFFKGKGSVRGVQAAATELGRIVEYSREVTRLETGRINSQEKLKGYGAEIAKYNKLGLDTSKAQETFDKYKVKAGTNQYALAEKYNSLLVKRLGVLKSESKESARIAQQQFGASSPVRGAVDLIGSPINKAMGTKAAVALEAFKSKTTQAETKTEVGAVQDLQRQKTKALQDGTKTEVTAVQDLQRQKTKALQDGTKAEVALAQQKQKTITTAGTKQDKLVNRAELLEQSLLQAKTKGLDVENAITRLQQVKNTLNRADLSTDINQLNVLERTLNNLQHQLKVEKAIAQTSKGGAKAPEGKKGAGGFFQQLSDPSSKLGSAVIGGGFPALMGGGPGAMIGGALGGAVGGFAGSIAASAIGQAFDDFAAAATEVSKSLTYPIEGFEKLKEASLFASREQEYYISKLIETGRVAEATAVIQAEMIKKVGVRGVNDLAALGESSIELSKVWAEFNLQLQAALAGPMTGLLKWLTGIVGLVSTINAEKTTAEEVRAGLSSKDRAKFDKEIAKIRNDYDDKFMKSSLLPGKAITYEEARKRKAQVVQEFESRSKPQIARGALTPEDREKAIKAAEQQADTIKDAYRTGFRLQQQGIDLQRQGSDLQRRVAQDIYNKQQEILRLQVDNDRQRKQVAIEMVDLEYRRRISNEEGRVAAVLEAEAALMKTKAEGEANIEAKKRLLELDIDKQKRETENYIFDLNRTIDGIRRSTLSLEMDVADYRLKIERQIGEQRRIEEAGQATGASPSGGAVRRGALSNRQRDPDAEKTGWDITMPGGRGASVQAPLDLTITGTGFQGKGSGSSGSGYGNWISGEFQLGGKTYELLLGHFDKVSVSKGMKVPAGGSLGTQGITGRTFGSHVTTHVNPLKGATVEDAWNALGKVTDTWEKGTSAGSKAKPLPSWLGPIAKGANKPAGPMETQLQNAAGQAITRPVVTPNVAGVQAGMGQYNEKNAALRKQALSIEQELNNLAVKAAQQRVLDAARGPIDLKQRREAVLYAEADLRVADKTNSAVGERLALEAQSAVKLAIRKQDDSTILSNYDTAVKKLKDEGKNVSALVEFRKELVQAQKDGILNTEEQIELDLRVLNIAERNRVIKEQAAIQAQLGVTGKGLQAGFIGQAGQAYESELQKSGGNVEQAQALAAQTQALELATTKARALEGAYNDIGSAMASTLTDGVAGLVAGTTTAEQVFSDFLKNIGQALMKAAQQMIAQYLAIAAAKALAGLLGGGGGGSIVGGDAFGGAASSSIFSAGTGTAFGGMSIPGFAEGGRPPVGVPSLVGEKGPELFVPSSSGTIIPADATAAMARYQRQGGGSGGGNSSSDAMGDGAAATPVLSMSFETTRFLGQDYVSTDQLQAAMMATEKRAAAAGAKAGAAQVTSKLQQSPAYRRQVGLR